MKKKNQVKAWLILLVYLAATCALVLGCYVTPKPAVREQDFPITLTCTYQGKTETLSPVYAVEFLRATRHIGESGMDWYGYIRGNDGLQDQYIEFWEDEGECFVIYLNIQPGYLMGDPEYADARCQPTCAYYFFDGNEATEVTDPDELAELGFGLVSWEYPEPIENSFASIALALSAEASVYLAAIAVAALLACVILIRRDRRSTYGSFQVVSIILNFLVIIFAFPLILITSSLSEILGDRSMIQQLLYYVPALTAVGVGASVTLRRLGHKYLSFWIQFAGPAVFLLVLLIDAL